MSLNLNVADDEYVSKTSYTPPNTGTLIIWYWANNLDINPQRICGNDGAFEFVLYDNTLRMEIYDSSGEDFTTEPGEDKWVMACCTFDNDVDDVNDASYFQDWAFGENQTGTTDTARSAQTMSLGTREDESDTFDGKIAQSLMFSYELSYNELYTIYFSDGAALFTYLLDNKWMCMEGAPGTTVGTVIDVMGNQWSGSDMTGQNGAVYGENFIRRRRLA
jgi:hypothetical protein